MNSSKLLPILFILITPCYAYPQTPCESLPPTFNSYTQASIIIKKAKYKIFEEANTSGSSFITAARYYSCDGQTGFLIINIGNRQYLHKGLPVKIWLLFKQASSFGTFYNQNIRNKYRLSIEGT